MSDTMSDPATSPMEKTAEQVPKMLEKIFAAAQPGAVYGQPVSAGDYTVITASEVASGGGFGFGWGSGPAPSARQQPGGESSQTELQHAGGGGMGGGGGARGRAVATIVISPNGVRVEPIVDVNKIALAAMTALGAMIVTLLTIRKKMGKG